MSDRSRSPARARRTEADLDIAARAAEHTDAQAALAGAHAALAEARRELADERERRAADQRWAAERRQEFVDFLRRTFRDCTEMAVLARGAGVSSDLIEYWYRAPAPPEPEPEAEPEPQ
jgi:hypothetical protein